MLPTHTALALAPGWRLDKLSIGKRLPSAKSAKNMEIVEGYPPNYEQIKAAFNPDADVVFTYGNTLYSPNASYIDDVLLAHEKEHAKQQTDPEKWWHLYITDVEFRISQELAAYRAQYRYACTKYPNRADRFAILVKLAHDMSGPIYGNCIDFLTAFREIKS